MQLTRLKLDYFGKLSGKEILLKPGLNIIYGENEAGKSTIHAFIKGMLFGIERLRGRGAASKDDIYTRYLPWDYPGAYGGQMDILVGEKHYRLIRSFHANDRCFTVTDLETGREIKLKEGHIGELIPGLSEAAFRNTISIEQLKARTDAELAAQVKNYITNLSVSKSKEVNVVKATELLKQKKKALESVPYESKLKELAEKIKEGEETEEKINLLTEELKGLEAEKERLMNRLVIINSYEYQNEEKLMEELPAIIEKYRMYKACTAEYSVLKNQIVKLKSKTETLQYEVQQASTLKNDLNKARMLENELDKYRKDIQNAYKIKEDKLKNGRIKILAYAFCSLALGLVFYVITRSYAALLTVLTALSCIGGVIYIIYNKNINKAAWNLKIKEAKEHYSKAETEINHIYAKYRVSSLSELANKHEDYLELTVSLEHDKKSLDNLVERMKSIEDNCDELHDTIMLYMRNFITADELTDQEIERLQDVIIKKKKEKEDNLSRLNTELSDIKLKIEKINWELSGMEDNETRLLKNKAQYEELLQRKKEAEAEVSAIDLAIDTINRLSETIHDSFGKELNRAVAGIISEVTDGKYKDIKIDEELNIQVSWKDNLYKLDRLSAGTIDQIYFALRLAVADLLLGGDNMPLILDDSFALYDDNRLRSALKQIADRSQVLIFSCQMREKTLLQEMGLPYNFIKL
ncbi:MAG TPA: AAA family ATPase [Mobilitalea sp.]|nr:AAA family ATPase [Mobilitalea sp.]